MNAEKLLYRSLQTIVKICGVMQLLSRFLLCSADRKYIFLLVLFLFLTIFAAMFNQIRHCYFFIDVQLKLRNKRFEFISNC